MTFIIFLAAEAAQKQPWGRTAVIAARKQPWARAAARQVHAGSVVEQQPY